MPALLPSRHTSIASPGIASSPSGVAPHEPKQGRWIPIRTLQARHRAKVLEHLRQLPAHDRYLRFGHHASDAQIARYVESIEFARDEVFGIFNRRLDLIGVAHLAHTPASAAGDRPSSAEFGVSVLPHARRRRLGGRLFAHAILHARNRGVETLLIHALTENGTMLRMAARAGAEVIRSGAEAQACLKLPPETIASCFDELVEQHAAELDFQFKRQVRQITMFWKGVLSPSGSDVDGHDDARLK